MRSHHDMTTTKSNKAEPTPVCGVGWSPFPIGLRHASGQLPITLKPLPMLSQPPRNWLTRPAVSPNRLARHSVVSPTEAPSRFGDFASTACATRRSDPD